MSTIPKIPDTPRIFDLPKLAISATFASKAGTTFSVGLDGVIGGWLYVHVTDAQGNELPPDKQPRAENFKLFEISSTNALIPVQHLDVNSTVVEEVGALKDVLHQFSFVHTPDLSNVEAGQIGMLPFMLIVSPAGTGFAPFAKNAGTILLPAVVLNPVFEMQTRGGSLWGG